MLYVGIVKRRLTTASSNAFGDPAMFGNIIFRQLFDAASSTYTYVLGDPQSRQAVIIDRVFEQHFRDRALLEELGLELVAAHLGEIHVLDVR
jgi:glyoxylase-like metal-dependent hydrolase (beta-lactamase superfamily II)